MEQATLSPKSKIHAVARSEWLAAILVACLVAFFLMLPYFFGYALSSPGLVFSGVIMNPEDTQSYFAKMLQGYEGSWLYTIPFTPERHEPAFLGVFYLALGHIARWVGLSIEGVWHLARFVAGVILFVVTFGFIATFLENRQSRWIAYLLAIFGSGLGWFLFIIQQPYWLGYFPVDFKMPEAHLFFSALTFPHVAIGTSLVLLSFWFILQMSNGHPRSWMFSILAGFSNLALGIAYPFLIYLVFLTAALYWLLRTYRQKGIDWLLTVRLGISFIIPAPLYLYYAYANQMNDVFRSWADQAVTSSPPLPHYLIAFGTLLLLAILPYTSRKASPAYRENMSLLWLWILAAAVLVYLPINAQRRFVQGVHVPLSILAAGGIMQVLLPKIASTSAYQKVLSHPRYSDEGLRRLLLTSIILFFALSNLYLIADVSLTTMLRQPYPFFREESEIEVLDWLRENTERTSVIMVTYESGNFIAARAGNRVFTGHWAETVNSDEKFDQTAIFYNDATQDSWRQDLLRTFHIDYVWHGPAERNLGAFDPGSASYLNLIYESDTTRLYAFQ